MSIINDYGNADFGRRINVMISLQTQYQQEVEFCRIEFKTEAANESKLQYQQSKNIRINTTMLNDIIGITKDKSVDSIYMDWWDTSGYVIQLFKEKDHFVAQYISSVHTQALYWNLIVSKHCQKYVQMVFSPHCLTISTVIGQKISSARPCVPSVLGLGILYSWMRQLLLRNQTLISRYPLSAL